MPFIAVGSGDDLILTIPTDRTTNWGANFKTNFAEKIATHNHTGSGNGQKLSGASIADNGLNGTKILLDNDEFLRGRNNADSANINIIKVNTSDKLENGADFSSLTLANDTYLRARDNADSAYINMLKIKTDDTLEIAPAVTFVGNPTLSSTSLKISKTFSLANNQTAAANITGATVTESAGKSFKLIYSIYVDATTDLIEKGEAEFSYDGTNWNQAREYSHDDTSTTFSIASGQLKYANINYAGFVSATLTYQIIEL